MHMGKVLLPESSQQEQPIRGKQSLFKVPGLQSLLPELLTAEYLAVYAAMCNFVHSMPPCNSKVVSFSALTYLYDRCGEYLENDFQKNVQ